MLLRLLSPLLLLFSLAFLLLRLTTEQIADPDLWGRLSIGAILSQTHHFPYHDYFSYTSYGAPWIDHEWLSGLIFYQTLALTGEPGLLLLKYSLLALTLLLLYRHHPKHPTLPFYALLLLTPIITSGFSTTIRCQTFSFLLFTLFISLLESVRTRQKSPKTLLWLLPLIALWANLHGGFVLGILLVFLYGIGALLPPKSNPRPYFAITLTMILVTGLLNPYGFSYWHYILDALALNRNHIPEWRPLPLLTPTFWELKLLILTTLATLCLYFKKRPHPIAWAPILVTGMTLLMALKSIRFQTFLPLAVLCYLPLWLPSHLPDTWQKRLKSLPAFIKPSVQIWIPALIGTLSVFTLTLNNAHAPLLKSTVPDELTPGPPGAIKYPVAITRFLQASPWHGNILNLFTPGEFLYWELYPRFKVAVDGRYEEVYTHAQVLENHRFYQTVEMKHPERTLRYADESGADFLLIQSDSPNLSLFENSPQWQVLIADPTYTLLVRASSWAVLPPFLSDHLAALPLRDDHAYTIGDFFTPGDLSRFKSYPTSPTSPGQ